MTESFQNIQPLKRETAVERIAEQIRAAIVDGTLPPGTQLTEIQLAARFGVSRGPLREATQRLVQEGLLRSEHHRGVFVTELDRADVADIYYARAAIERTAVMTLLHHPSPDAIAALTEVVEVMEAAADRDDFRGSVDADLKFHETLVAATGSKRLVRMFRTLVAETRLCLGAYYLNVPLSSWRNLVAEHRTLLDALDRGAEAGVYELLDTHLALARNLIDSEFRNDTAA